MKYNIGDFIEESNLDIIDKKTEKTQSGYVKSMYKYKCRTCGFDCGKHYVKGVEKDENWARKIKGCGCCNSYLCVTGINDIATTDPWMMPYFVEQNECYRYKSCSNAKTLMRCIYCGKEKIYSICQLFAYKKMPCECCDKRSYPNKFSYYMFMQLIDRLDYYDREYSPSWAGRYRYDNYFVYRNKGYVVEMDGGLGHGKRTFGKWGKPDTEGLKRDIIKEQLAYEHNIQVIRVDSIISSKEYLKENLIKELNGILDLSGIDWDEIERNVYANEVKHICDYYKQYIDNNDKYDLIRVMSSIYNISEDTIKSYLKIGTKLGWISYSTEIEIKKEKLDIVCDLKRNNHNYTSVDISKITNIGRVEVVRLLNEGTELGLCEYDGHQELVQSKNKRVYVYYKGTNILIKSYESVLQCCEKSIEDFGTQFSQNAIYGICNGRKNFKSHKGYYFSYEMI